MNIKIRIFALLSIVTAANAIELQRLALLTQDAIKITKGTSSTIKTMCIDRFRAPPNGMTMQGAQRYDQIIASGDIAVKINGKTSNLNAEQIFKGDNSLLRFDPDGLSEAKISINPNSTLAKNVNSVELLIRKSPVIGNKKNDNDISHFDYVVSRFGDNLNQRDFWKYSVAYQASKKIPNLSSLEQAKPAEFEKVVRNIAENTDVVELDAPTIADMVAKSDLIANAEGDFTNKSAKNVYEVVNYKKSFKLAEKYREDVVTDDDPIEYNDFKSMLVKRQNPKDTTIEGVSGYVLLSAFKVPENMDPYLKDGIKHLKSYTTPADLNSYALFALFPNSILGKIGLEAMLAKRSDEETRKRLIQLLGLSPRSKNDHIYEFWVKSDDFFLPSRQFDKHLSFLDSYYTNNHNNETSYLTRAPFSEAGFTIDWGEMDIGVPEFIIEPGKSIYLRRSYAVTNDLYLELIKSIKSANEQ